MDYEIRSNGLLEVHMYEYGEACPISKAASVLCERWTLQILRELMMGASRFSELQKLLPRISPSVLNARLKTLSDNDIVVRKRIPEQRGYEYRLTPAGRSLEPLLNEFGKWGICWLYDGLSDEELSAAQCAQHFCGLVNQDGLPTGTTVIEIVLEDVKEMSRVFISIRGNEREVCDENSGHEVDVFVRSTLRTLTEIMLGDRDLLAARESGMLKVTGPTVYTKNLAKWFPFSRFAADNPRQAATHLR